MRHFILQSIAAAGMLLAVDIAVIVVRVVLAQKNVSTAFTVPPETEVVFIGNSHTGCTFAEAPEFRNRAVWHSGTGFMLHYLRFLELERRGAFDANMKVCVLDCDASSLLGCAREPIAKDFILMLPLTWRYWDKTLLTKDEVLRTVLMNPSKNFTFCSKPPPEIPNWATRTAEERASLQKPRDTNARPFQLTDIASDV